jgi:putative FmdB family regulatory protein
MPKFEFERTKCGKSFARWGEDLAKRSLPFCPHCGGRTRKIFTAPPAIIFKGHGFHCNDYAKAKLPA